MGFTYPRAEEGGLVDNGSAAWGSVPLIRKVRLAMRRSDGGSTLRPAVLRRDVGGLLDRLERLRQSFPDAPELLDRVRLSPHVINLLEEARGLPLAVVEGGPLR